MKKLIKVLLGLFLSNINIVSCSNSQCYRCYFGNMIELSDNILPYDTLNNREVQNNLADLKDLDTIYHFNYYLINNENDLNSFYEIDELNLKDSDKNNLTLSQGSEIITFVQIPQGYKAYKKNNIQYKYDDKVIMISDNFYYYANRNNISYLNVYVKKDEKVLSPYVYSFVIKLTIDNKDLISKTEIRLLLNE